jgi:hypothetical protein
MRCDARQRCLTIFIVLLGLVPAAEAQDAAAPRNVDPVLPYAPLEKQRISPDPLPNLAVSSIPGIRTIVLREYQPTLKPDQTIPPVVLHIPDKFFSKTTGQPAEVWGTNLLVQYPTMGPLKWPRPCGKPWCGDEILISLRVNRYADSEMLAKGDQHANAMLAARDDPLVVVTPKEPPSGYSHDYVEYFPRPCGQTWPRCGCTRARRIPQSLWRACHIGWRCAAAP